SVSLSPNGVPRPAGGEKRLFTGSLRAAEPSREPFMCSLVGCRIPRNERPIAPASASNRDGGAAIVRRSGAARRDLRAAPLCLRVAQVVEPGVARRNRPPL